MACMRNELDAMLQELECNLPKVMQEIDVDRFMETFVDQASVVEESAGPVDIEHVRDRINVMLRSRDVISGVITTNAPHHGKKATGPSDPSG